MKLLLKSYLIILCLTFGIGTSWAEIYTIDFNKGTTNGTDIKTGTFPSISTLCQSGSEYIASYSNDGCYYNTKGCGIRIAKSNGDGSFNITLSESLKAKNVDKIVVYASKVYGNEKSSLTITTSGTVTTETTFGNSVLKAYSFPSQPNSAYILSDIKINGTLENLTFTAPSSGYVMLHQIDIVTNSSGSTPQPTTYNVNIANDIVNGTVTASSTSATAGTEITLSATPSEGYEFGSWSVTTSQGSSVSVTNNKFTMPEDDVNVSATFNKKDEGNVPDEPGDDTGKLVYKKIKSQSDILNGGVYLIVCESQNTAMGSQSSSRRNNASVTISNSTIALESVNEEGKPYEVTLGMNDNKWIMILSNNKYLGNGALSTNQLREVQSIASGYHWSITYEESGGVKLDTDCPTSRTLCVNTSLTDSYSTYIDATNYEKVTLYKKVTSSQETTPITLNSACHDEQSRVYASYSNDKAWVVPADLTVEEIGVTENGRLTLKAYATGAVVPANTGVMVSASAQSVEETKGNYTVNISDEQGSSVLGSENRLRPASNITADEMAAKDPNCLYYRLTMHNGEKIGYWWGAGNGAAFAIEVSNKAYLAVPKQKDAVKYMGIWLDDASCIDVVKGNDAANGVAYNLAGQRVTADVKGIVIVNGKKVFNK